VKVTWKGVDYGAAVEDLKVGDVVYVERAVGIQMGDWSTLVNAMAIVIATVRRRDPDAITFEELEALDVDELDDLLVDDTPKQAGRQPADRKAPAARKRAAAADPLGGGSPASSASRGTRGGPRKAAARSRSAEATTSST
jgi:hypothetical protein